MLPLRQAGEEALVWVFSNTNLQEVAMKAVDRATLRLAAAGLVAAGEVRPGLATTEEPIRAFRAIQEVFHGSCALSSCHSAVARKGGLILEHEDVSWAGLVDQ